MKNKLRTLITTSVIAASLPLFTSASEDDRKITLCHNGHSITISVNAYQKHLDNHNKTGAKLTCYVVTPNRPCKGVVTVPYDPAD